MLLCSTSAAAAIISRRSKVYSSGTSFLNNISGQTKGVGAGAGAAFP